MLSILIFSLLSSWVLNTLATGREIPPGAIDFEWITGTKDVGFTACQGKKLISDPDQSYFVVGHAFGELDYQYNHGGSDGFVTKSVGYFPQQSWTVLVGDSGNDTLNAIARDSYGYLYAVGGTSSANSTTGMDFFIVKISSYGNVIWTKSFGTMAEDNIAAITVDAEDNIYIAANTDATDFNGVAINGAVIMKLDTNGDTIWISPVNSPDSWKVVVTDIVVSDSSIYVSGGHWNSNDWYYYGLVFRFLQNGTADGSFPITWEFDSVRSSIVCSLEVDKMDMSLVTSGFEYKGGYINSLFPFYPNVDAGMERLAGDFFMMKYDENGGKKWVDYVNGTSNFSPPDPYLPGVYTLGAFSFYESSNSIFVGGSVRNTYYNNGYSNARSFIIEVDRFTGAVMHANIIGYDSVPNAIYGVSSSYGTFTVLALANEDEYSPIGGILIKFENYYPGWYFPEPMLSIDWINYFVQENAEISIVSSGRDSSGFVYAYGTFSNADIPALNLYNQNGSDCFVLQIDGAGNLTSTMVVTGSDQDTAFELLVAADDSIFISGSYFNEKLNSNTAFIRKYDRMDLPQIWESQYQAQSPMSPIGSVKMESNHFDKVFCAVSFGKDTAMGVHIAKIDSFSGHEDWSISINGSVVVTDIAVNYYGDLIVSGYIFDMDIGGPLANRFYAPGQFVAMLSTNGIPLEVVCFGGRLESGLQYIDQGLLHIGRDNSIYVTARNDMDILPDFSISDYEGVLLRFNSNLNLESFTSTGYSEYVSLSTEYSKNIIEDSEGNFYFLRQYTGRRVFVFKFGKDGELWWSRPTEYEQCRGLAVDSNLNVYMQGGFAGSMALLIWDRDGNLLLHKKVPDYSFDYNAPSWTFDIIMNENNEYILFGTSNSQYYDQNGTYFNGNGLFAIKQSFHINTDCHEEGYLEQPTDVCVHCPSGWLEYVNGEYTCDSSFYSESMNKMWSQQLPPEAPHFAFASDASGEIFIVSVTEVDSYTAEVYLSRYSSYDGYVQWQIPLGLNFLPKALYVDSYTLKTTILGHIRQNSSTAPLAWIFQVSNYGQIINVGPTYSTDECLPDRIAPVSSGFMLLPCLVETDSYGYPSWVPFEVVRGQVAFAEFQSYYYAVGNAPPGLYSSKDDGTAKLALYSYHRYDNDERWWRVLGDTGLQFVNELRLDDYGNIYLLGNVLVKFDDLGNYLWTSTLPEDGHVVYSNLTFYYDYEEMIIVTWSATEDSVSLSRYTIEGVLIDTMPYHFDVSSPETKFEVAMTRDVFQLIISDRAASKNVLRTWGHNGYTYGMIRYPLSNYTLKSTYGDIFTFSTLPNGTEVLSKLQEECEVGHYYNQWHQCTEFSVQWDTYLNEMNVTQNKVRQILVDQRGMAVTIGETRFFNQMTWEMSPSICFVEVVSEYGNFIWREMIDLYNCAASGIVESEGETYTLHVTYEDHSTGEYALAAIMFSWSGMRYYTNDIARSVSPIVHTMKADSQYYYTATVGQWSSGRLVVNKYGLGGSLISSEPFHDLGDAQVQDIVLLLDGADGLYVAAASNTNGYSNDSLPIMAVHVLSLHSSTVTKKWMTVVEGVTRFHLNESIAVNNYGEVYIWDQPMMYRFNADGSLGLNQTLSVYYEEEEVLPILMVTDSGDAVVVISENSYYSYYYLVRVRRNGETYWHGIGPGKFLSGQVKQNGEMFIVSFRYEEYHYFDYYYRFSYFEMTTFTSDLVDSSTYTYYDFEEFPTHAMMAERQDGNMYITADVMPWGLLSVMNNMSIPLPNRNVLMMFGKSLGDAEVCEPGTYSATGYAPCSSCPTGSTNYGYQMTSCPECMANYFRTQNNMCSRCPRYTFSNGYSNTCSICIGESFMDYDGTYVECFSDIASLVNSELASVREEIASMSIDPPSWTAECCNN